MSKVTSAKTKGRLTKKELKQDRLVKLTFDLEQFYLQHQKWVWAVAIAILVIIGGVIMVRKSMEGNLKQANYQLTMAKTSYGVGQLDEAKTAFQNIVTSEGGVIAAEAKYFLGRIAFEQGNYAQAVDEFNAYLKDYSGNAELDAAAISGLAASDEALNKPEDAAKEYERVAEKYPDIPFAPQALTDGARLYLKVGQTENAVRLLRRISDRYTESPLAAPAKRQLDALQ